MGIADPAERIPLPYPNLASLAYKMCEPVHMGFGVDSVRQLHKEPALTKKALDKGLAQISKGKSGVGLVEIKQDQELGLSRAGRNMGEIAVPPQLVRKKYGQYS